MHIDTVTTASSTTIPIDTTKGTIHTSTRIRSQASTHTPINTNRLTTLMSMALTFTTVMATDTHKRCRHLSGALQVTRPA